MAILVVCLLWFVASPGVLSTHSPLSSTFEGSPSPIDAPNNTATLDSSSDAAGDESSKTGADVKHAQLNEENRNHSSNGGEGGLTQGKVVRFGCRLMTNSQRCGTFELIDRLCLPNSATVGANCNASRLVVDYLRLPCSASEGALRIKTTSEIAQRIRFAVPCAEIDQLPLMPLDVCEAEEVNVVHFITGRVHHNLMHSLYRVASIQFVVTNVVKRFSESCGRVPRVHVRIIPRTMHDRDWGAYSFFIPLLTLPTARGRRSQELVTSLTVATWPEESKLMFQPCRGNITSRRISAPSTTGESWHCLARVVVAREYIQFYDSLDQDKSTAFLQLRRQAVVAWNLKPFEPPAQEFNVVIINRLKSRRIRNIEALSMRIAESVQNISLRLKGLVPTVHIVELEGLTAHHQAKSFVRANLIIAVHGAALAWSFLMSRDSTLLEIVPSGWGFLRRDTSMFAPLSKLSHVEEHKLFKLSKRQSTTVDAFSANFSIRDRDLQKIVSFVVAKIQKKYSRRDAVLTGGGGGR